MLLTNLFAFWLRSSVVSVLFSVTTETAQFGSFNVTTIFAASGSLSGLAHGDPHCVVALTLPASDAIYVVVLLKLP